MRRCFEVSSILVSISTFDKGEAAGLGIFINSDLLINEAGLGAVVEAGDALPG